VDPWTSFGKLLVVAGGLIALLGVLLWLGPTLPGVGRLPGDLRIERPGYRLYLPVTTSILLSLGLTLALYLLSKLR